MRILQLHYFLKKNHAFCCSTTGQIKDSQPVLSLNVLLLKNVERCCDFLNTVELIQMLNAVWVMTILSKKTTESPFAVVLFV